MAAWAGAGVASVRAVLSSGFGPSDLVSRQADHPCNPSQCIPRVRQEVWQRGGCAVTRRQAANAGAPGAWQAPHGEPPPGAGAGARVGPTASAGGRPGRHRSIAMNGAASEKAVSTKTGDREQGNTLQQEPQASHPVAAVTRPPPRAAARPPAAAAASAPRAPPPRPPPPRCQGPRRRQRLRRRRRSPGPAPPLQAAEGGEAAAVTDAHVSSSRAAGGSVPQGAGAIKPAAGQGNKGGGGRSRATAMRKSQGPPPPSPGLHARSCVMPQTGEAPPQYKPASPTYCGRASPPLLNPAMGQRVLQQHVELH